MTIESGGPTYFTPYSVMAAARAVGAAVATADAVFDRGSAPAGLVLTRPPGHHAVPGGPKGFCLYNSAAVVARHLQTKHGVDRVAIVDWDVHYGNGTADAFIDDDTVLYLSTHQERIFPFEGNLEEVGCSVGEGYNVALPLPAGTGRELTLAAWDAVIAPKVTSFLKDAKRGFLVVSSGFDAHFLDPTAQFALDAADYHTLGLRAKALADEVAAGRVLFIMEGGYHVDNGTSASRSVGGALGVSVAELARSTLGLPSLVELFSGDAPPLETPAPSKGLFGGMFGSATSMEPPSIEAQRFAFYGSAPRPEEPMAEGMRIIEEAAKLHGM